MKSMKKSMFVTTILMVVLLIVALSTATFAWYTAQTTVTATSTQVNTASSTAASLAVDKNNTTVTTNSSVTLTMNGDVAPMIPKAVPTVGTTTYSAFIDNREGEGQNYFFKASVDNDGVFTSNGNQCSPAIIGSVKNETGDASAQNVFYVVNTNASNPATVNVTVTIDNTTAWTKLQAKPGDWDANKTTTYKKVVAGEFVAVGGDDTFETGANYAGPYYAANATNIYKDLRIAVFAGGVLKGTWSYEGGNGDENEARTHYGTITLGNAGSGLSYADYTTIASNGSASIGTIAANSTLAINVVAWFDGVSVQNDEASSAAFFTMSFSMAA